MVGNIVDVGWATIRSGCLPITGFRPLPSYRFLSWVVKQFCRLLNLVIQSIQRVLRPAVFGPQHSVKTVICFLSSTYSYTACDPTATELFPVVEIFFEEILRNIGSAIELT